MKPHHPCKALLVAACLGLTIQQSNALVTLNYFFGVNFDSGSVEVADGTLWALVVDSNDDDQFFGGFGLNQGLATSGDAEAFSLITQIAIGDVLGGDTVFAMGGYDSAQLGVGGTTSGALTGLEIATNGLATGRDIALYWFPNATYSGPGNQTKDAHSDSIGTQVGGVNWSNDVDLEMVVPSNGFSVNIGPVNATAGGTAPDNMMTAAPIAIPEPSSALLGVLGSLLLLRRQRKD